MSDATSGTAPIAVIVLAAGRSTRMGEHKLLLTLNGQPLIGYALTTAVRSDASDVIVVLGHDADAMRKAITEGPWRLVVCAEYAVGMSASLRAGVEAVAGDAIGVVILLADQPLVSQAHLRAIFSRAAVAPDRIIATGAGSHPGTPVYFPRALFGELLNVTGDEGGRSVIARHRDLLELVEPEDERELLDVDDPESFRHVRTYLERATDRL